MHSTLVSTALLAQHLGESSWRIVDVRHDLASPDRWGEGEYAKGHVPGALFVHVDRDLSAAKTGRNGRHPLPDAATMAERFSKLGIAEGTQVVAYDQGSGMFAARLWWMLRALGHQAVALLDGGFDQWQREGRRVATEVPGIAPTTFVARPVASSVDVDGVQASLAAHSLILVDARSPERFRGDSEAIDPVAGHVPGARNRPFAQNLGPDGTFKPPSLLHAEYEHLLGGAPLERVVHMCGSGVSACHNVLAMEIAGLRGTRLYPGSWSEWCADPARPVARGEA